MEKKILFMKKSIKGLAVIGMTVQIGLGLIWLCVNLFSMQEFSEAAEYIEVSRGFVLDEYIGILYPMLLFLLRFCFGEKLYLLVLYLLQAAVAFFCSCIFLHAIRGDEGKVFAGKNVFGALYLLTIPFVMQLHLAVLPLSLLSSLFLLLLGFGFKLCHGKTGKKTKLLIGICILWAIMSLLMPDYIWLGVLPLVWVVGLSFKKRWAGKEKKFLLIGMVMALLVVISVNALTQQPGSRGKIQRTLGAAMVSRLAWPCLESNYFFWPEEVKTVMSQLQAREIDQYADNVKLVMGPLFEEAFGKEQANKYYWKMALRCVSDRTKEILPRIGEDFVSYLFTPFAVCYQLSGGGTSYSGWNYDRMWAQAKELTGVYVNYGLYSFFVGMAIVLIGALLKVIDRKRLPAWNDGVCLCAACALFQSIWYTMSGTYMMDYKNVPVVMMLWYALMLLGLEKLNGCEE